MQKDTGECSAVPEYAIVATMRESGRLGSSRPSGSIRDDVLSRPSPGSAGPTKATGNMPDEGDIFADLLTDRERERIAEQVRAPHTLTDLVGELRSIADSLRKRMSELRLDDPSPYPFWGDQKRLVQAIGWAEKRRLVSGWRARIKIGKRDDLDLVFQKFVILALDLYGSLAEAPPPASRNDAKQWAWALDLAAVGLWKERRKFVSAAPELPADRSTEATSAEPKANPVALAVLMKSQNTKLSVREAA